MLVNGLTASVKVNHYIMASRMDLKYDRKIFDLAPARKAALAKAMLEGERLIKLHFVTRQSEWRALKPATIADRKRKGFGPTPILIRVGTLRDSLAVEQRELHDNYFLLATDSPIAYQQDQVLGRSFYDMDSADEQDLADVLALALAEAFNK